MGRFQIADGLLNPAIRIIYPGRQLQSRGELWVEREDLTRALVGLAKRSCRRGQRSERRAASGVLTRDFR
jgi:hypothetical protein